MFESKVSTPPAAQLATTSPLPDHIQHTQLLAWMQEPDPDDFQARLAAVYRLAGADPAAMAEAAKMRLREDASLSMCLSECSHTIAPSETSTRALSEASRSPVPSLIHTGSSVSSAQFSICTSSLASAVSGIPFLDPGEDHLRPPRPPRFECFFGFLGCFYYSDDMPEWKTHILSHFHPHEPPKRVQCPLCPFRKTFKSGREAWDVGLNHVAWHHHMGYGIGASKPDFILFDWLWRKRIINCALHKELMTGGGVIGEEGAATTTHDAREARRRG